jgi:hypothetical protein
MDEKPFDDAVKSLKEKENSTRCEALKKILEGFGFVCKERNSGKHYTFKHTKFTDLVGRFDGAHGRDSEVKAYGVKVARNAIDDLKFLLIEQELQSKKYEEKANEQLRLK